MIITVVTKFDFANYVPSASAAVLRIYDPVENWFNDAELLGSAGWGATLALSFWDVGLQGFKPTEGLFARLFGRWRGLCVTLGNRLFGETDIPWRPFLAADAHDIARFGDQLDAHGIRHLIVVCGNGRARSWTIAKWLAARLSAQVAPARGWQRESDGIARVLKRVPARTPENAAGMALSAAE